VTTEAKKPNIPESFLEIRQVFDSPWIDRWTIPNPFIGVIYPLLKESGVELSDVAFSKDPANISDTSVNFAITKLNAAIRVGLDHVTFLVGNPDWSMAPTLVQLFDTVSGKFAEFLGRGPSSQKMALAFHVVGENISLANKTSKLVNHDRLGSADFFGVSLYREDYSLVIDKSMRHEGAAYIRIQRTFNGEFTFAEIAPQLYEDEVNALALLDITGID
jgi:hypothetical protein